MTDRAVIEREPIELPVLPGIEEGLWLALLELAEVQPNNWTLIGGQMVLLHALENGARLPRVSTDLDVLVNARIATGGVKGRVGLVPRPSLLGAIICKACAVEVDDARDAQRSDLALLLSLVPDPLAMADELDRKDRQRLRRRSEMDDPAHQSWLVLDQDAADRGLAAYRLLTL